MRRSLTAEVIDEVRERVDARGDGPDDFIQRLDDLPAGMTVFETKSVGVGNSPAALAVIPVPQIWKVLRMETIFPLTAPPGFRDGPA